MGEVERDILEQKIMNKQAKLPNQEWQETFDSINDMISVHDENHKLIRVNKAFAEAFNMKPEDLIGRYCHEIVHGTDKPIPDCPHIRIMNTKKPCSTEIFEPELNAYLDIQASPLLNEAGELLGSIHITRDVTRHKKVDQELRESEERYRTIVNLSADVGESVVMLQDTDQGEGIQTFVSDQWPRVTGFSKEELLGTPFFNLLSPQYRQASLQRHRKKMRGKVIPSLYDMSIIRKDGAVIPIELTSAYTVCKGEPCNIAYIRDITERKKAEEALRQSEENLRAYLENVPDGIYINDTKGKILYGNKKAEEVTGYKREELVGKSFLELKLFTTKYLAKAAKLLALSAMGKSTGPNEFELIKKDGKRIQVEISTTPIKQRDEIVVIGFVRDITERKKAEEQIEAALLEKEVLLKEIHHRVKNNMQVISSLLKMEVRLLKNDKAIRVLKDSQNRIQSMALVYNKLYQSKDLSNINLREYVNDLVRYLIRAYDVSVGNVSTRVNIGDISLGVDLVIPYGLIINELYSNALKYAFPGDRKGEIEISVREMEGNTIEIVFSDNGVGFPDDLDIENASTLGLQLVSSLVKNQLHGKLDIERSGGTKFIITLDAGKTKDESGNYG